MSDQHTLTHRAPQKIQKKNNIHRALFGLSTKSIKTFRVSFLISVMHIMVLFKNLTYYFMKMYKIFRQHKQWLESLIKYACWREETVVVWVCST